VRTSRPHPPIPQTSRSPSPASPLASTPSMSFPLRFCHSRASGNPDRPLPAVGEAALPSDYPGEEDLDSHFRGNDTRRPSRVIPAHLVSFLRKQESRLVPAQTGIQTIMASYFLDAPFRGNDIQSGRGWPGRRAGRLRGPPSGTTGVPIQGGHDRHAPPNRNDKREPPSWGTCLSGPFPGLSPPWERPANRSGWPSAGVEVSFLRKQEPRTRLSSSRLFATG